MILLSINVYSVREIVNLLGVAPCHASKSSTSSFSLDMTVFHEQSCISSLFDRGRSDGSNFQLDYSFY